MRLTTLGTLVIALLGARPAQAQRQSRVEVSVVGGVAHTDRASRVQPERWIEPTAGVQLDVRALRTGLGLIGLVVSYDQHRFATSGTSLNQPCTAICLLFAPSESTDPVAYSLQGSVWNAKAGLSLERPLGTVVRYDGAVLIGWTQSRSTSEFGDQSRSDRGGVQPTMGWRLGLSTDVGPIVAGVQFDYAMHRGDNSIHGRNRTVVRLGYVLP
jgi:hypothetical protein